MRVTLYIERPSQTSTYYSWRENVQMSSLPNKTVRKDNLTSHQRVCTSALALKRKQKASEAQLSSKRINLPIETQHPTNLKWKITHQESVTPSKHPRLENIIDPSVDEEFLNGIEKHQSQDQVLIKLFMDVFIFLSSTVYVTNRDLKYQQLAAECETLTRILVTT